ncbi:MAG TPA: ATP-binding protein [Bryobacteraceae bacterium]|nr:ATP-binding protein [Bryobacteraceae bacterium]
MSLRVRLVILIVLVVTLVSTALSALYLDRLVNSLSASAIERSELASREVNAFIIDHINRNATAQPAPADSESAEAEWTAVVSHDKDIAAMLERTMALSPALVEINVADVKGTILASSNPSRDGTALAPIEMLRYWQALPFYRRIMGLIVRSRDYQVVAPLGIAGQAKPLFTVQVVASSVLLRSAVLPEVETLAEVSGGALLASLALTVLATSRVLRPLRRIENTIDRISQGQFHMGEAGAPEGPKEFAALESKLNILGQQYSGAQRDATKMKQSVDEMIERMASQLDVASRLAAISRITGGVAHEIKNPLNAIVLRLDVLKAHAGSGVPEEEMIPEIDVLSREVRRLDRVVKTFLDFSRPVDVHFTEIDLAALAREVTDLMRPQAERAGVELVCNIPAEPALMRGDADMLKQAILNLVMNALEAMKGGGHLRIDVAAKCDRGGDYVDLAVEDDGPGIPPELREKVFQLYFTTKERGSGIGLAMTYRAVQLHNGTVDFVSDHGRGTAFRLRFPALAVRHA